MTFTKFLASADQYCFNVQAVCFTVLELRPVRCIPFSFWMM